LFNKSNQFFTIVDICLSCEDIADKVCDGAQMAIFCVFFSSCIFRESHAAHFRHAF